MVLYASDAFLDFPRYGIKIPSLDSQKVKTVKSLLGHSALSARRNEWLIEGFQETTTMNDLSRVFSPEFAQGFFDDRATQQFIEAYELMRSDGSHNRWAPEEATHPLHELTPSLLLSLAGTWKASQMACDTGFCQYMGGGAHHGHRSFGHGFCPMNDVAVGVARLQSEGVAKRIWVIDTDAHKGDGTAAIFHGDDTVKTMSIHMARGWPLDGTLPSTHPSWIPSDIDVPVESGEEGFYLDRLKDALGMLRQNSTADLAIVLAGADPWEHDGLASTGLLRLTLDQMIQRDRMVYCFLEELGLPSAWLTAGGYGEEVWRIHTEFLKWVLVRRLGLEGRATGSTAEPEELNPPLRAES